MLGQGLHDVSLRGRLQEADEHGALLQDRDLALARRLHLQDGIRFAEHRPSAACHFGAGLLVQVVRDEGSRAGAPLDADFQAGGDQHLRRLRDEGDAALSLLDLLGNGDFHAPWRVRNPGQALQARRILNSPQK